ncbi:MAG TPA: tRNA epoxyqueuosine(34) reductase QueG, partial [Polyangiaceae bacterium]|nr:tRNA epoxyqueuosine(34) reductase QueG [Polyangiaceae bacterium]
ARGRDYHGFLKKRLRELAAFVRTLGDCEARALCDTAPVLERAWAARAGLGFIGKNGMLIVPGQGSFCLLGEVVTTLAIDAEGTPMGERCGSCRACIDVCPTGAFDAPFVLDPRRCVSYATIESRKLPPPALEPAMDERLFGCDDCQRVCPYNSVPPPPPEETEPFRPLDRWAKLSLDDLVNLDDERWREVSNGTPLKRATRKGLARNALLSGADARRALDHDDADVRALAARLARVSPAPLAEFEAPDERSAFQENGDVDVWLCEDQTVLDPKILSACYEVLDETERARHARFKFERHRHQFLVAHALVRWTLSRYAPVAPAAWRFVCNEHGRPEVSGPDHAPPLAFNLSHTDGLSACAVGAVGQTLGVDVEALDRRTETTAIADRFFSELEVRALRALPEAEQRERFFAYWTLKESYIKARGMGLAIPLGRFSFELDRGLPISISFDPRLEDEPERWRFALLRASERHFLAVATAGGGTQARLRAGFCVPMQGLRP